MRDVSRYFILGFYPRALDAYGCVLWAHGRSATESLAAMMAPHVKFCGGAKESFRQSKPGVSEELLARCIAEKELFTHLKPMHLRRPESELRTAEAFFGAARRAGFTGVVALWRRNELAWLLSRFEGRHGDLKAVDRHLAATEHFCGPNRTLYMMRNARADFVEGVDAAIAAGLRVVRVDFSDVVRDGCRVVRVVFEKIFFRKNVTCDAPVYVSWHAAQSHFGLPLEERVGIEATTCIRTELLESSNKPEEYGWMLDQNATRLTPPYGNHHDL